MSKKSIIKTSKTSYKIKVKDINVLEKAERDKARNYKESFEEEKRSLFFK